VRQRPQSSFGLPQRHAALKQSGLSVAEVSHTGCAQRSMDEAACWPRSQRQEPKIVI
jgi:hypothetical protein